MGRRRRQRTRVDRAYGARNAAGGKVPDDRALVLSYDEGDAANPALRPWRRQA